MGTRAGTRASDTCNSAACAGVFQGAHYKDGSIAGSFYMEMCTLLKCDPAAPAETCTQVTCRE